MNDIVFVNHWTTSVTVCRTLTSVRVQDTENVAAYKHHSAWTAVVSEPTTIHKQILVPPNRTNTVRTLNTGKLLQPIT